MVWRRMHSLRLIQPNFVPHSKRLKAVLDCFPSRSRATKLFFASRVAPRFHRITRNRHGTRAGIFTFIVLSARLGTLLYGGVSHMDSRTRIRLYRPLEQDHLHPRVTGQLIWFRRSKSDRRQPLQFSVFHSDLRQQIVILEANDLHQALPWQT